MKHQFVIDCRDDQYQSTRLHEWVNNLGWVIKQDYEWTSVMGHKIIEVIIEVDDPNKAMLIKLVWG